MAIPLPSGRDGGLGTGALATRVGARPVDSVGVRRGAVAHKASAQSVTTSERMLTVNVSNPRGLRRVRRADRTRGGSSLLQIGPCNSDSRARDG
jgi:hypothetical protein